ncbi:MAG: L-histidine N(alpha)-methyltransferase [Novosphingobium sp.]|nr:L-histidine N(alpha)-methyltransferase [Novosphingobium sp.]
MTSLAEPARFANSQREMQARFRKDVLAGLSQQRKAIPARYFYDRRGSELFEKITALPEYYPTRTETEILAQHCDDVAKEIGTGWAVIEFGAGSATKTPLLLSCIDPSSYVPIDISSEFLSESCDILAERFPKFPVFPVVADFTHPVTIPFELAGHDRLGFFPGSTIGNLEPAAAVDLLSAMRQTLGSESMLLIGMDMIKEPGVLISAYDDAAGVTAVFNLNLAERINRELDGTIAIDALRHKVLWNADRDRIEMHLEATRDIGFHVCGRSFTLLKGETIHTENSHKYDERCARQMLLAGGWCPDKFYFDDSRRFMLILASAIPDRVTP